MITDYDYEHTNQDVLKENYIYLADITDLGYPRLPRALGSVKDIHRAVSIENARKELYPRESICHCFVDDSKFLSLWNQPHKQIDTLRNFKYVCMPDFSTWCSLPLPLQQYNKYRNHALAWYLLMNDVNIIPSATWSNEESFSWCFDGMPRNSIISISSNGCMSEESQASFRKGYYKMLEVLEPKEIVWVGSKIEVDNICPVYYYESDGQITNRKGKDYGRKVRTFTETEETKEG